MGSATDKLRYVTVYSLIDALEATVTTKNSIAAFRKSGLVPGDAEVLRKNPYVVSGSATPKQRTRVFYNLNEIWLTSHVDEMYGWLLDHGKTDDNIEMQIVDQRVLQHHMMNVSELTEGRLLTPLVNCLVAAYVLE